MKISPRLSTSLILLLLLTCGYSASATAETPDQRIQKINDNGGFMVWKAEDDRKSNVDWGIVDALIPAPTEKVLELLRDYDGYKNFLKFFTTTKVLDKYEDHSILRLKATIAGGSVKLKATATIREETLPNGDIHFKLRYRKGNVDRLDGDWIVTPLEGGKCLLKIRLLVDPDLWLVSNSQLSEYNLVNARRTQRSIKKILAPGK